MRIPPHQNHSRFGVILIFRTWEKITKCRVAAGFLAWPRREGGGNTRSGVADALHRPAGCFGRLSPFVRFGPVVSGQYTYLGVTPFTESGADSLNLRVRQQNLNSLQLNVGGRLAYTWSLADGKILLIPQARMFWNHEFLQNSTSIWSSLDGGAGPGFEYRTINPSRDSVFAGVGLLTQLGRNWNASVCYNRDFGSATSHTQIVSASAGFLW
jgi:uncharacterized protein with beta-barrel porin domain